MSEEKLQTGLTFDDVLLIPSKTNILPTETDIKTELTRRIKLSIPLVSAPMDTVTESEMAVMLAREGGIGFIHRGLSPEKQALEVEKVKKSESGIIIDPFTITPNEPISRALELMKTYRISGVPVTTGKKLVGIITNRDLRFETNLNRPVKEVMTKGKLITAPTGTTLDEAKEILHRHKVEKLLIVDDKYNLKGLITIKDIEKKIQYPNACKDRHGRLMVGAAIGVGEDALMRASLLYKAGADALTIDTAHGHSKHVIDTLKRVKNKFDIEVIAGNIATEEAASDLIKAGADAIKVGMGPGSICTTRIIAGAGVPQLTAIKNCYRIASRNKIPLIADGGIKYSGDITKALAAGSNCVMIGSLFAGTAESPGEIILYEGRSYKNYRGMGSIAAMQNSRTADRYGQRGTEKEKLVPEGIEGRVPYRGPVSQTIYQLIGGIRAGMGYCGARNLSELRKKAKFIQITNAGFRESHVHDVIITQEAPNYKIEK